PSDPPSTASLKILLPTGDVFDRDITNPETQIGKGPRNDLVIADPAVSTAHAILRRDGDSYTISDIGNRSETGAIDSEVITAAVKQSAPPPLTEDSLAAAVVSAKLVSTTDVDRV